MLCILLYGMIGTGQAFDDSSLNSQYCKFKKIFLEEIRKNEAEGSFNNPSVYHISPSPLPEWLLHFPPATGNCFYTAGISDPSPMTGAIEQAVERALGIGLLLNDLKSRHLKDVFSTEYEGSAKEEFLSKFEELYHFCPNSNPHVTYEISAVDTNRFGEVMVLLKVSPKKDTVAETTLFPYTIYCFNMEYEENGDFELSSKTEIFKESPHQQSATVYTWNETGKAAGIKTFANGNEIPVQASFFRYKSVADSLPASAGLYGRKLQYGLWFGYLNSILKNLQNRLNPQNLLLKNVEEHYSQKHSGFTREISVVKNRFLISSIRIIDNEIFVDLQNISAYEKH